MILALSLEGGRAHLPVTAKDVRPAPYDLREVVQERVILPTAVAGTDVRLLDASMADEYR